MKRIDESHWQCPKCKGVFAIGELFIRRTGDVWHKAGTPTGYCKKCEKKAKQKVLQKRQIKLSEANGDAKNARARRKLEGMRELAQLEAA